MGFNNLLHMVDLFSQLEPEQVDNASKKCNWHRYKTGVEIVTQMDQSTDIFFVAEGRVSAKGYSREGKEVNYAEIASGEIFGEFSALDGKPRSASIETLEESYIGQMSAKEFRSILSAYPSVGLKLSELLVQKNRHLTGRMFEFSTLSVRNRICAELLRMIDYDKVLDDGCWIDPAPSHYQIATRLSTHREAVTRELSDLAVHGILEIGRKKIKVIDISHLRAITQIEL